MAAFRTLRFYHNAIEQVAQRHGLAVKQSRETIEGTQVSRSATILLPNGCPVPPWDTATPEALDKFLTLILPAVREQAKSLVTI
jgi:hypothetical protein